VKRVIAVLVVMFLSQGCGMVYEAGEMAKGTVMGAARTVSAGIQDLQEAGLNSAANANARYGNGRYDRPRIVQK